MLQERTRQFKARLKAALRAVTPSEQTVQHLDRLLFRPVRLVWKNPKFKFPIIFVSLWFVIGILVLQVEVGGKDSLFHNSIDTIYYTVTTVTGTGYGDITPRSSPGRILAMCLMFVGVVSVSTITANIASYLVEQTVRESKGLMSYRMQEHYLICGYKPEMATILENILQLNHGLLPEQVVLVHNADPAVMDSVRSIPRLKGVNFVHGEFNDDQVLARADAGRAKTALVFADMTNPSATAQEIDSRTLTAVLSLRNLSRDLYICAELLDEKLEKHLRLSGADEIIMSQAYSRTLLANASTGSGVSQVIRDLIDVNHVGLKVIPYPQEFVDRPFRDLMTFMHDNEGHLLIGILENVGNVYHRKSEALREAQKEPDISKLVRNLQIVKQMVPNRPIINPGPDYVVPSHSSAIVVFRHAKPGERGA